MDDLARQAANVLVCRGLKDALRLETAERLFQEGWSHWDLEEAYRDGFECFERGIELDPTHAGIQYALGEAFYFGRGVPCNSRAALEWLGKAAAQGDAAAQCSLGWMYLHGHGVPKDHNEAAEWYREAAIRTQGRTPLWRQR
jgi:TPR repeat protein